MAEARLQVVLDLVDRVSGQLKGVTSELEKHSGQLKKAGAMALGFGAALTAGLTMAVKAAAEEEAGITRLSQALANVGVSYDQVKESLEATIVATQKKTGIADDQQREALQRLMEVTGDYNNSLSLLRWLWTWRRRRAWNWAWHPRLSAAWPRGIQPFWPAMASSSKREPPLPRH